MPNRKKRIKKGISSLKEQIAAHQKKIDEADPIKDAELIDYWKKEIIENLEKSLKTKENILSKKKK